MSEDLAYRAKRTMDEFPAFVDNEKASYIGTDGTGERRGYVPYEVLDTFWTSDRISAVLLSHQPHRNYKPNLIRQNFLRIFSLLVYANLVPELETFVSFDLTDHSLGRDDLPEEMRKLLAPKVHSSLRKAIKRHQWLFTPISIDPDKLANIQLSNSRILPYTLEEVLSQSDSSTVRRVVARDPNNSNETVSIPPSSLSFNPKAIGHVIWYSTSTFHLGLLANLGSSRRPHMSSRHIRTRHTAATRTRSTR